MIQDFTRAAIETGIPSEEVAEQVLEAVVQGRFWILTHPSTKKAVEARMRGILEDRAPEFDPTAG
jgi:hypothetical protein